MVHSIINLSRLICLIFLLFFLTIIQVEADNKNQSMKMTEIVVTPGKFSIVDHTRSNLTLPKEEIEDFPLIDNDIMRSAQIFPGVVSNDFSARFSVRGGEKDEILVNLVKNSKEKEKDKILENLYETLQIKKKKMKFWKI